MPRISGGASSPMHMGPAVMTVSVSVNVETIGRLTQRHALPHIIEHTSTNEDSQIAIRREGLHESGKDNKNAAARHANLAAKKSAMGPPRKNPPKMAPTVYEVLIPLMLLASGCSNHCTQFFEPWTDL